MQSSLTVFEFVLAQPWLRALLGGLLIGTGAAVLLLFNGQIAGISGIASSTLRGQAGPLGWRAAFLVGLVAPAAVLGVGAMEFAGGYGWLAVSGLLVGLGTRTGSGCTSGHGVCGIANLSPRSALATVTFMVTAMVTVFVVRHVLSS